MSFEIQTTPESKRVLRKHHRKVSVRVAKRSRTFIAFRHNANIDGTMESDTQSVVAENKFYKTSDHLLQKEKISLRHAL